MSWRSFHFSPVKALLLFWPFQSLPRIWFLASAELPPGAGSLGQIALSLGVGFLRDGLLVAALLLPIQLFRLFGGARSCRSLWPCYSQLFLPKSSPFATWASTRRRLT